MLHKLIIYKQIQSEIKAILEGGVMLKAKQQDVGAIVEYSLLFKVTVLPGYSSSLKMDLWLDTSFCGIQQQGAVGHSLCSQNLV